MRNGRPTKLDEETKKRITNALRVGATRRDAVMSAGIYYQTFLNWLERGKKARESGRKNIYLDFLESVEQAEAEARLRFTTVIAKAAQDGDWRAAIEFLKRRDRENWGDNYDVTSGGEPLRIVVRWGDFADEE